MTKRVTKTMLKAVRIAAENGATDREIAELLDMSERSLYRLKHTNADLVEALKVGKAVADDRVEQSLYRRATGYSFDTVKVFMPAGCLEPVCIEIVEHVPPDTTAAIFWLKNRRKEDWRDKQELEVSDQFTSASILSKARQRAGMKEKPEK
ncbi:helix-turn-helix domain-containing protein [Parasphingorhabdus sp.]|uniref:helix-turn-helix domain-containing protein n=1 Tax=Parasphingorhabdus sp. TaxID=2709688 RepID=UPI002F93BB4D